MTPWLVGLDLGQTHDPTALAIARQSEQQWGQLREQRYEIGHLERFPLGMSYPEMVVAIKQRLLALPRPVGYDVVRYPNQTGVVVPVPPPSHFTLVIDATGVGRPVAEMFRVLAIRPIMVTLTHGFHVVEHADRREEYSVPKRTAIGAVQVAIQSRRLKVARSLPDAAVLIQEAQHFDYKLVNKTGDDQYDAWRENTHDDLLLAVAVMVWYQEHLAPPQQVQPVQSHATGTGNVLLAGRKR